MDEILRNLRGNARVLDLGSRDGSFVSESCPGAMIVRLDMELPSSRDGAAFVQADAARLPFRDRVFDAVIANHSLEHMSELAAVLKEIGRVIGEDGSLYVAVPDASTFSDRVYRWIYHGGGHVNPFRSADSFTEQITRATKLPLTATRVLSTSFGFLNRRHFHPRPPRRLWLFGNGNPAFIAALSFSLRIFDRVFGTRGSVYGWAFYFGKVTEEVEGTVWTNVCSNCGAGHSAASLICNSKVRRVWLILKAYDCPNCGGWNLFTEDRLSTAPLEPQPSKH
jgi:SAM-dependent methyltransferase